MGNPLDKYLPSEAKEGKNILDLLTDNAVSTEGLLPGQTPIRDTSLSKGGRATSRFKDTVQGEKIDWDAWEKAPANRKNFYFVNPDSVSKVIKKQYRNYFKNPTGYGLTINSTVEDAIRKFDQENPGNKIKKLQDKGIDIKRKLNSFDISSLNPFHVEEAQAAEIENPLDKYLPQETATATMDNPLDQYLPQKQRTGIIPDLFEKETQDVTPFGKAMVDLAKKTLLTPQKIADFATFPVRQPLRALSAVSVGIKTAFPLPWIETIIAGPATKIQERAPMREVLKSIPQNIQKQLEDILQEAGVAAGLQTVPITDENYGNAKHLGDVWGTYYKSITGTEAPEWYKSMAGLAQIVGLSPLSPEFKNMMKRLGEGVKTGGKQAIETAREFSDAIKTDYSDFLKGKIDKANFISKHGKDTWKAFEDFANEINKESALYGAKQLTPEYVTEQLFKTERPAIVRPAEASKAADLTTSKPATGEVTPKIAVKEINPPEIAQAHPEAAAQGKIIAIDAKTKLPIVDTAAQKVPEAKLPGKEPEVAKPAETAPGLPKFKSTEEALAFGKKASPEQRQALKAAYSDTISLAKQAREAGDLQKGMDLATEAQLYREAGESAAEAPKGEAAKPLTVGEAVPPKQTLIEEAKKYKTAEEFVEKQPKLYHGSDVDIDKFDMSKVKKWNKFGHFFAESKEAVEPYGDKINEAIVDVKNPKIISQKEWWDIRGEHAKDDKWFSDWKSELKKQGYDGLKVESSEEMLGKYKVKNPEIIVAFEDNQVTTKSQLTDIWNKAHAKEAAKAGQKLAAKPLTAGEAVPPKQTLIEEAKKYKTAEEFVKSRPKVYHGTGATFEQFDIAFGGSITEAKSAKGAFFFVDNPDIARNYAVYAAEEGPVKEILRKSEELEMKARKLQQQGKNKEANKLFDEADELMVQSEKLSEYEATFERRKTANVKEVILKGDFLEVDAHGKTPQELSEDAEIDSWLNQQIETAKKQGKDGVIFKNLDDTISLKAEPATHYAIFSEKSIKTKSQLTDIWNKAHAKEAAKAGQKLAAKPLTAEEKLPRINWRKSSRPSQKDNVLVSVDVKKLNDAWKKDEGYYLEKGEKFDIEQLGIDDEMIAPNVSVKKDGAVSFGDGRHRFVGARESGYKTINVSVHKNQVNEFKKLFSPELETGAAKPLTAAEAVKQGMSADEFIKNSNIKEGIKKYNLDDPDSQEELVNDIENTKKKGEYFAIGLRGMYRNEIGKKTLQNSFIWDDGKKTSKKLSGTSVIGVVSDWDNADNNEWWKGINDALKKVTAYGNTGVIAIVKGRYLKDEIVNDVGEFVLGNAKVIGYISEDVEPKSQLLSEYEAAKGKQLEVTPEQKVEKAKKVLPQEKGELFEEKKPISRSDIKSESGAMYVPIDEVMATAKKAIDGADSVIKALEQTTEPANFAPEDFQKLYKNDWLGNAYVVQKHFDVIVNQLKNNIKKISKRNAFLDDVAMNLYIEIKNDPQAIERTKGKLDAFWQKAVIRAQNLSPELKAIADTISDMYSKMGEHAKDAEVIRNLIEKGYVSHVWEAKENKSINTFLKDTAKFRIKTPHAKQRVFPTILDGLAAGYKLKIKSATNNLRVYAGNVYQAIFDKQFLNAGLKLKDSDGNPLFTTKWLEGYQEIKHPNFKTWKWTGEVAERGEEIVRGKNFIVNDENQVLESKSIYAPEKIARIMNNVLGRSALRDIPVLKEILKINNVLKNFILQMTFFHYNAFTRSFLFGAKLKGLKDINLKYAKDMGQKAIKTFNPALDQLMRNGLTLGVKSDFEDLASEGGAISRWQNAWLSHLFDEYGAGLKAYAAINEFENQLKKYPGKDPDEIAEQVSELLNNDFGGLNLKRMARNPTFQDILRLVLLAADWCVDSKTRAMTKTGWKYYNELNIGDEILAFCPETHKYKWSKLKDKYVNKNYDGEVIRIKNHNRNIIMTPEHKCYVYNITTKKHEIVKAYELQTNHVIPRCAEFDLPDKEIFDDYFIKIVGWAVTDGHIRTDKWKRKDGTYGTRRRGSICQAKPHTVKILKSLNLKYSTSISKNHDKFIANYPKYDFVIPNDLIKKMEINGIADGLTWEFLNKLSKRQLVLLYDTMMLGDGTGQNRFCGKEKEVFYMTLIQTMLGLPSTFYQQEKNCWRTRHIKYKYIYCWGHNNNTSKEQFKGTIWCPSVDTGFWFAEREGLCFITGNTESNFRTIPQAVPIHRVLRGGKAFKQAWGEGGVARKFWYRIILRGLFALSILNYLFAKKTLKENDPGHKLEVDVTPLLRGMGYTGKDKFYFPLLGHLLDPLKMVTRTNEFILHKSSVFVNKILTELYNHNWQGRPFLPADIAKKRGTIIGMAWEKGKYGYWETFPTRVSYQIAHLMPAGISAVVEYLRGSINGFEMMSTLGGTRLRKSSLLGNIYGEINKLQRKTESGDIILKEKIRYRKLKNITSKIKEAEEIKEKYPDNKNISKLMDRRIEKLISLIEK